MARTGRGMIKRAICAVAMLATALLGAEAAALESIDIERIGTVEFDASVIEASEEAPVVVEFYAEWCGYCQRLEPVLKALAQEYRGRLRFVRVDVDTDREVADRLGLRGVPTVVVFDNGMALSRISGPASRREFRQLFDSYVEPD